MLQAGEDQVVVRESRERERDTPTAQLLEAARDEQPGRGGRVPLYTVCSRSAERHSLDWEGYSRSSFVRPVSVSSQVSGV